MGTSLNFFSLTSSFLIGKIFSFCMRRTPTDWNHGVSIFVVADKSATYVLYDLSKVAGSVIKSPQNGMFFL